MSNSFVRVIPCRSLMELGSVLTLCVSALCVLHFFFIAWFLQICSSSRVMYFGTSSILLFMNSPFAHLPCRTLSFDEVCDRFACFALPKQVFFLSCPFSLLFLKYLLMGCCTKLCFILQNQQTRPFLGHYFMGLWPPDLGQRYLQRDPEQDLYVVVTL